MRRRDFLVGSTHAVVGAVLFPQTARAQRGSRWAALVADLEKLIPALMAETRVPGVSIGVINGGKLAWRRGFGVKNSVSQQPVDHDTVFEAASVSKTVFAYAVLKLCEKGVLGLDTPLTRYAPKPFLEGDARLQQITPRHVLSHSSGFQNWRGKDDPLKIHFTPGEKFLYSGEGYYYLQSVVTHLTGRVDTTSCATFEDGLEICATDIDDFMKRSVLAPFGMGHSGYGWSDFIEKHAALPHDVDGKPVAKKRPSAVDAARYASAGGLLTTATDYAKFLLEILTPKRSDAFRLTESSLREMVRPQVKLPPDEKIDGATAWALGWAIQERKEGNLLVHSGGQTGFRSLTMASVEKKNGFVVLTNGDNGGKVIYDPRVLEILDRLLSA